ncbi:hypothetical protein BDP55DRAFT_720925 [Colletotrichum godetiae]|uniref:Uncharacterized protein n=1 Tax=Colletotrichum godetiae TaxID=1209918 RepID=A0AAJ0A8U6_9PEZI|nr:uncharacterized protein BDP55DRAFT_720925 [Colletotrichum godetiae]KAK1658154.1 hypothetical protein BDP55DRAFT_720925 [Colletotrichum godetiae]
MSVLDVCQLRGLSADRKSAPLIRIPATCRAATAEAAHSVYHSLRFGFREWASDTRVSGRNVPLRAALKISKRFRRNDQSFLPFPRQLIPYVFFPLAQSPRFNANIVYLLDLTIFIFLFRVFSWKSGDVYGVEKMAIAPWSVRN